MGSEAIPESWRPALEPVLAAPEARRLGGWLSAEEAAGKTVYPPRGCRLKALALTPLDSVRVVILGQDPYPTPGHANGLAFSVTPDTPLPRSLRNIFAELRDDLGGAPATGDLSHWARQGVLLLNNALTVEAGQAGSHQRRGWEEFTDAAVAAAAESDNPTVFLLWGSHAQKKAARIPDLASGRHLVLKAPHPSPLSAYAGFFGSKPFSQANAFLEANGRAAIDWTL